VTTTILVSGTRRRDSLALAAAIAVAAEPLARGPVLLVELWPEPRRRPPTLLCAPAARELEAELRRLGMPASARGRFCHLGLEEDGKAFGRLAATLPESGAEVAVVRVPPALWVPALESTLAPAGGALTADRTSERALAALAVAELHARGLPARVETRAPGPLASRRALAGIRPGGETSARAARIVAGLVGGQRMEAGDAR
jgi:hypothetical protein